MVQDDVLEPYPLYNTTFTLHRVSPLYTGSSYPLDNISLQQHARRFRDVLAGDILRGVRVRLAPEDDALARVGALQSVTWQVLVDEERWNMDEETRADTTLGLGTERGILIQISYEKADYRAIFLRVPAKEDRDDGSIPRLGGEREGFQYFPLLLTRMPAELRETFTDFLSTTFDARVSVLHISGTHLTAALEKYISDCSVGEDGEVVDLVESSRTLMKVIMDVQVLIGFDVVTSRSLQTVDFHIGKEDIPRLVQKGKKTGRQKDRDSPFMEALEAFSKANLALNMRHESLRILRIACGAFVLGVEGE